METQPPPLSSQTRGARWWQIKGGTTGETVADLEDISRCMAIILATRRGSDPHRPEFGAALWQYIDWPVNQAAARVLGEAAAALARWEPRAEILSIDPQLGNGQLTLSVTWRPKGALQGVSGGGQEFMTEIIL